MLTEIRQIIFPERDLFEALKQFRRRQQLHLPHGIMKATKIHTKPVLHVEMTIWSEEDNENVVIPFHAPEVAAAMIQHCQRLNVPIPRKGSKALQLFGDNLGLLISMNESPAVNVVPATEDEILEA